MKYSLLSILLLLCSLLIAQKTRIIREGNPLYMKKTNGEWDFRDNLKDGRWIACEYSRDTNDISIEAYFLNRRKHGVVSYYYSVKDDNLNKYAEIQYKNGVKHGKEVDYNTNGTIGYKLTFSNGKLNGPIEINWSEGEPKLRGFYKNEIKDSTWTYYKYLDGKPYIEKVIEYKNGRKFLKAAWNQSGIQVVINGQGVLNEVKYVNGLKNGENIKYNDEGKLLSFSKFENNRLVKQILSYDDIGYRNTNYSQNRFIENSFYYDTIPIIDTNRRWIDDYITDIFENEIEIKYRQHFDKVWSEYYTNGQLFYKGIYDKGERIGNWNWYYEDGNPWLTIDYDNNIFNHYDSLGNSKSDLKEEFITPLTRTRWFVNSDNFNSVIYLDQWNENTITNLLVFEKDGILRKLDWLECGKVIGGNKGKWVIEGNLLSISIENHFEAQYLIKKYNKDKIQLTPKKYRTL